jgi:hypothetical protein
MARRRVGETKRRLSFAGASTPARVISTRPKRLEDQHIPRPPRPKSTCFAGAGADADGGGGRGAAAASAAGLVDTCYYYIASTAIVPPLERQEEGLGVLP